eukprot:g18263.t1
MKLAAAALYFVRPRAQVAALVLVQPVSFEVTVQRAAAHEGVGNPAQAAENNAAAYRALEQGGGVSKDVGAPVPAQDGASGADPVSGPEMPADGNGNEASPKGEISCATVNKKQLRQEDLPCYFEGATFDENATCDVVKRNTLNSKVQLGFHACRAVPGTERYAENAYDDKWETSVPPPGGPQFFGSADPRNSERHYQSCCTVKPEHQKLLVDEELLRNVKSEVEKHKNLISPDTAKELLDMRGVQEVLKPSKDDATYPVAADAFDFLNEIAEDKFNHISVGNKTGDALQLSKQLTLTVGGIS